MRYRVTVIEKQVYEVDVEEIIHSLATWRWTGDQHLQDYCSSVDSEFVLVEMEPIK